MKKKKDEAVVEEETIEMAAEPEKEEEKKEEMAAPEEKETPEEDKKEAPAEEKKEEMSDEEPKEEEKQDEFSFGFDASAAMSMMPDDDDACKMAKEEFTKGKDADFSVIAKGMYAAMCKHAEMYSKMSADKDTCMAEMSTLREFKASREEAEKKFAVDLTLKELSEKFAIPEETVSEMRDEGYKIEFSKLDEWKLSTKAKSVDFAVIAKKDGKEDVVRIGLLWNTSPKSTQGNLWVK